MGLLLLVDYFLVAILIVVNLTPLGRLALVVGTIPIVIYTVAEALHAFRPTQESLARADRLALVSVGTVVGIGVIVILVGLASGSLG